MNWDIMFFVNNFLLGVGLAMDAFSVSLANGMNDTKMKTSKVMGVAGMFAIFQGIMPFIGWICVNRAMKKFQIFERFIPWIALVFLCLIGIAMIKEGIKNEEEHKGTTHLGFGALVVQGIATSIDALSVGFTIAEYNMVMALVAALIIAGVTFAICTVGVELGKKFGTRLSGKSQVFGGLILIIIGIEIFITGMI